MRNLRLVLSLVGISIFALLILDFGPGNWLSDVNFAEGSVNYLVMGLIFFITVYFVGSESLEYFRLPRFHFKTALAILIASIFVIRQISNSDNVSLSAWSATCGIIFLLLLGFGEEMLSRGLIFGALHKYGLWKAIFGSSFLFGLLHLNVYIGKYWDPWQAYWHVMSAFGFGIFVCALMIVTRSIWVVVIYHALFDWGVVFDKAQEPLIGRQDWDVSIWGGISSPFLNLAISIGFAALLLRLDRGGVPRWAARLAIKWKLVKPELGLVA